jgi:hypothetical protein
VAAPLLFFVMNGISWDLQTAATGQDLSRPDAGLTSRAGGSNPEKAQKRADLNLPCRQALTRPIPPGPAAS